MYLMNHRSVLNGTPLDRRHTNIALEARALGYDPVLFGYTDTSVDPRDVPADDPRLRHYEGVLPGFSDIGHLPEGDPRAWLVHLRDAGYSIDPDGDWRAFVDRPALVDRAGDRYEGVDVWGEHRAPTQYEAKHSQSAFLTDQILSYLDERGSSRARRGAGQPWFVHASYLRPHPPFFAPEPYNTMYDPHAMPPPVRAASPDDEAKQHPLMALLVHHPFLAAPTDEHHLRQLRATYHGLQTEVDHHVGRLLDWLDQTGEAANTLVVLTSDHGEQLGDHYLLHKLGYFDESYHVPLIVHDPRPEFDVSRGQLVAEFTENVDVTPTVLDLLGAAVPLQCDGRSLRAFLEGGPGARPADWRRDVHWEFDFRDPDGALFESMFGLTMEECALAVVRDDHGKYVHFSGDHVFPPLFFDLDEDPMQLHNRAADPAAAPRVLEYAQRMLSWRMRHAERTLTGMKLTEHAGLVERHDPRAR
jgi:arylsulfatase A-like enzyme